MKLPKALLLALTLALFPHSGFSLSIWMPETFGEYVDFLDDSSNTYKIVYGRFTSVSGLTIEDTTQLEFENFIANGYVSKTITAQAVFQLVDPRRAAHRDGPRRTGRLNVLMQRSWSSAPDFTGYTPDPDDYLNISFAHYANAGQDNKIMVLRVAPDGSFIFSGLNYSFSGPFRRESAAELTACVFDNACRPQDIRNLRRLRYRY